ncbi:hypothetical protein [Spirillospora sp. NBC_01491]|uniref:hypothetical protein n=1 Tax=Spirillospora sp. NBC_01491 TaxID=2976007 RepID=UPI002E34DA08|nr:hypothetical protein [Spirillospora sp. NBC_01491]
MISPLIVTMTEGCAVATCHNASCARAGRTVPHEVARVATLRTAENAADRHLKVINRRAAG